MQFFIGIVPPGDYKERIVEFQKRWQSNQTWRIVEPHITVKAQSGLGAGLHWLAGIKRTCRSFPRFTVSIGQPETFGDAVVYLSVHSTEIRGFHEQLVEAVSPPPEIMEQYMEKERFVPHLTLGQTHWGMSPEEVLEMKASALVALSPFPTFSVDFIRVFQGIEPDGYLPYEDIDLA